MAGLHVRSACRVLAAAATVATGVALSVLPRPEATPSPTPAAIATEQKLDAKTHEFRFEHEPLRYVLNSIGRAARVNIELDPATLVELPLSAEMPVTFRFRDMRLRKTLDHVINEVSRELTYTIRDDGTVLVLSDAQHDRFAVTKAFDVSDLLPAEPPLRERMVDKLRKLVVSTVAPNSWTDPGGSGTIGFRGDRMVVRQTPQQLEMVESLLEQLREVGHDHVWDRLCGQRGGKQ